MTYASGTQTLTLEDGGTPVSLTTLLDNTDNQDLQLNTNTLSLTNDASSVDLSSYLDNTDDQAISYNSGTQSLSLEDGGSPVDLSALNQDLSSSVSGTNRTINISGGSSTSINVSDFTPSAFKAVPNGTQGIPSGAPVQVLFSNAPDYDTGNYEELNSQYIIPSDGLYNFSGLITFNNTTSGPVIIMLMVNNGVSNTTVYQKRVAGGILSLDFSCDLSLSTNNRVTVWINNLVVGSISTADTPSSDVIYFSGRRFN